MCWNVTASVAMVGLGAAATVITARRGEPSAIWLTMGYFTAIEALQAAGYGVIDECGSAANRSIALLSYLHIAFQPLFINAFIMAIAPAAVGPRMRRAVYVFSAASAAIMLLQLVPLDFLGKCLPGTVMCGPEICLVSGEWHIAWELPLNDLFRPVADILGIAVQFPSYIFAVFVVPLFYGAWRFVLFHLAAGPLLAMTLTSNPNEMPAIWCLFSIGILLIGLSGFVRYSVMGAHRHTPA